MHSIIKVLAAVIAALVIIVVGLLLYIEHGNLNMWIDDIEQRAQQASGFDVDIQGELDVAIGNPLHVSLGGIHISNPESASETPLAMIDRLAVSLDTWSLLRGPVVLHSLELAGAEVDLQVDDAGRGNWQTAQQDDETPGDGDAILPERIDISISRVGYNGNFVTINGSATFDEHNKPSVIATVSSSLLEFSSDADAADAATPERMFSDDTLDMSWAQLFNIEAQVAVDKLIAGGEQLEALAAEIELVDGSLAIEPISFETGGGEVSATLQVAAVEDQVVLQSSLVANQVRLAALVAEGQNLESVPPLDIEISLSGSGLSLHDIAASANGQISGAHGEGQINMEGSGLLFSDMLTSVLRALNPLAETEAFATLECSIIEVNIENGMATVDELAAQMDRLIIIGSGEIDLDTESLDLVISTKTREGLGISLGGVVNSMLAIGGTLTSPAPKMDAAGSVTTAGAAVATGGLSVLAKGLWDRLSAEVDVCATE